MGSNIVRHGWLLITHRSHAGDRVGGPSMEPKHNSEGGWASEHVSPVVMHIGSWVYLRTLRSASSLSVTSRFVSYARMPQGAALGVIACYAACAPFDFFERRPGERCRGALYDG